MVLSLIVLGGAVLSSFRIPKACAAATASIFPLLGKMKLEKYERDFKVGENPFLTKKQEEIAAKIAGAQKKKAVPGEESKWELFYLPKDELSPKMQHLQGVWFLNKEESVLFWDMFRRLQFVNEEGVGSDDLKKYCTEHSLQWEDVRDYTWGGGPLADMARLRFFSDNRKKDPLLSRSYQEFLEELRQNGTNAG